MSEEFKFKRKLELLKGKGFAQAKPKGVFQGWKNQGGRLGEILRPEEIDLRGVLIAGETGFDAETWADITGNLHRASMLLPDSPHVQFLEQYREVGERLFQRNDFVQTSYYKNAEDCVRFTGSYFNQRTIEGLIAQAKSYVTLYERMMKGDSSEVSYLLAKGHSEPGSHPVVRKTWTSNIFQIDDGLHRLAATWVLGQKKAKVVVLSQSLPTALQSLVGKVSQELGERDLFELHQPIEGVEFDQSWPIVRKCHDRFQMMLAFLNSFMPFGSRMSVVDLGCSYGWFVAEFAKRGHQALGIDSSPAALKIGQIAYRLNAEQVVKVDLQAFFDGCDRTFDVVLLLSILQHFVPKSDFGSAKEILKRVDTITGSVLFLDTGQSHEKWFHDSLPEWDDDFIIKFIQRHTSFKHVIPLGVDSDNIGGYGNNFRRTLFACVRSKRNGLRLSKRVPRRDRSSPR